MKMLKRSGYAAILLAMLSACASDDGTDAQGQAPHEVKVLAQDETGMSLAASSTVFARFAVSNWELQRSSTGLRIQGLGVDGNLVTDMSFATHDDGSATILDHTAETARIIDARGAIVSDQFSDTSQQMFDAISLDATAIRDATKAQSGMTRAQGFPEDIVCTRCYGVLEFCGHMDYDDYGLLECVELERCGWCVGFWW